MQLLYRKFLSVLFIKWNWISLFTKRNMARLDWLRISPPEKCFCVKKLICYFVDVFCLKLHKNKNCFQRILIDSNKSSQVFDKVFCKHQFFLAEVHTEIKREKSSDRKQVNVAHNFVQRNNGVAMNRELCRAEEDKTSNVCVICPRVCLFWVDDFGAAINVAYDHTVGSYQTTPPALIVCLWTGLISLEATLKH